VTVGDLDPSDFSRRLARGDCTLQVGPFLVRIRSGIASVREYLRSHYAAFDLREEDGCHFSIAVQPPANLRRFIRPQALFSMDPATPFSPVPRRLAPGMIEWGLNWCIGTIVQHWIVVHSGVVERKGRALLLPATPGSGKSTLSAALSFAGWRLLSDEFALVHPATGLVYPLPRPVALKAGSIDVIGRRCPEARFGPLLEDAEGTVVRHVAPLADAVRRTAEPARAAWIVTPRYQAGAPTTLEVVPRSRMLAYLADSSFNHNVVGREGFERLAAIVDGSTCHKLTYSDLDEAVALFDRMADQA
jgi:HprK-related kinase A